VDPDSLGIGGVSPLQPLVDAVPVPELPTSTLRADDGGLVLVQQATDTLWEFWGFSDRNVTAGTYQAPDGRQVRADYTCLYAGRIRPVSGSLGVFPYGQGSSSTSLPYANGLFMFRDVVDGVIAHSLTLVVPVTGSPVAPATRGNRISKTRVDRQQDEIATGTLFRLPPGFDPAAAAPGDDDRSRLLRMVLTAIRDYGLYVSDAGPTMNLNAEGRTVVDASSPYYDLGAAQVPAYWGTEGLFWGENNLMLSIPWDQLQVVAPHSSRSW
jgi:hypothetical protein